MSEKPHYHMSLSLNVLNHLGLNLYSNIPSVLSETVANSWDADAENVFIEVFPTEKKIVITDNGCGMNLEDINNKYLQVGYRKEDHDGRITPKWKRKAMGRKGIGKLSLFSIAHEVEIQTVKDDEKHRFLMEVDAIKEKIKGGEGTYEPKPLDVSEVSITEGTKIILTELKKQVHENSTALRKRLARRFGIIGKEYNFSVKVNSDEVEVSDRDYYHKLQYIWYFGKESEKFTERAKNVSYKEERSPKIPDTDFEVSGWIGTVEQSGDLKEGEENLNKILLLVRGKLAQEDILADFNEGGVYSKYIIGEIDADFLDLDDRDDIATSSRQQIVEDDPRYSALKKFVAQELKHIQNKWTDLRNQQGANKALEIPAIKEWYKGLESDTKKKAAKLFGKINQLTVDSSDDKRELFKYSILAFENLRYRGNLEALEHISPENITSFGRIFDELNDIDATLYYQIVYERLEIIKILKENVETNVLEKLIQSHIYKNLWLIDPAWERASESAYLEERVKTAFDKITAKLTKEEEKARFDIRYATSWGKHIIIELKRASVVTSAFKLGEQVDKYRQALRKLLEEVNKKHEPIESVCLVGKPLSNWQNPEERYASQNSLAQLGIRVVLYQELIDNAYRSYKKYLDKSKEESGRVFKLIQSLDDKDIEF
ncbi:MAG: BbrUII/HgiDII family restriction enzyme [Pyrinomonadaceae bacterium]